MNTPHAAPARNPRTRLVSRSAPSKPLPTRHREKDAACAAPCHADVRPLPDMQRRLDDTHRPAAGAVWLLLLAIPSSIFDVPPPLRPVPRPNARTPATCVRPRQSRQASSALPLAADHLSFSIGITHRLTTSLPFETGVGVARRSATLAGSLARTLLDRCIYTCSDVRPRARFPKGKYVAVVIIFALHANANA